MNKYLLDTNCFYAVSKNRTKQDRLHEISPNIATSLIAILEIAKISKKKGDFEKRKRAMEALKYISPKIIEESPDDIVDRSFGLSKQNGASIDYKHAMRTLLLANSYNEAISGVNDFKNKNILKIVPEVIDDWKKDISGYFTQSIVFGNKQVQQMFLDNLKKKFPEINERRLKTISKQLSAMTSKHEHARKYVIAGLSVRAGLHTESQLHEALKNGTIDEFASVASKHYNGLVNSYIDIYLAFQNHFSNGQTPEQNAIFDLEFFFHLDAHNIKYIFVTTEESWIRLAEKSLKNRVIHLDTIVDKG